jgi:hypothetical protein
LCVNACFDEECSRGTYNRIILQRYGAALRLRFPLAVLEVMPLHAACFSTCSTIRAHKHPGFLRAHLGDGFRLERNIAALFGDGAQCRQCLGRMPDAQLAFAYRLPVCGSENTS